MTQHIADRAIHEARQCVPGHVLLADHVVLGEAAQGNATSHRRVRRTLRHARGGGHHNGVLRGGVNDIAVLLSDVRERVAFCTVTRISQQRSQHKEQQSAGISWLMGNAKAQTHALDFEFEVECVLHHEVRQRDEVVHAVATLRALEIGHRGAAGGAAQCNTTNRNARRAVNALAQSYAVASTSTSAARCTLHADSLSTHWAVSELLDLVG